MTRRGSERMHVLLLVGALAFGAVGTVPAAEPIVALTENQNGSIVEVARSQRLEIRLPVQGGTGFSWELEGGPSTLLRLASSEIRPRDGDARPSGAQVQALVFTPVASGSGDIALG